MKSGEIPGGKSKRGGKGRERSREQQISAVTLKCAISSPLAFFHGSKRTKKDQKREKGRQTLRERSKRSALPFRYHIQRVIH